MAKSKQEEQAEERQRYLLASIQEHPRAWIIAILVIIALVVFTVYQGYSWLKFALNRDDDVTRSNYHVQEIGELDAVSVAYDKTISSTEAGHLWFIHTGDEKWLYIFHFKAQIYYDLKQAKSKYDKKAKTLTITMPKEQVKLLLRDGKYAASYKSFQIKNSNFVAQKNDNGLELQKKAIKDVNADILNKKDFITDAQTSVKKTLKQMYRNEDVKLKFAFTPQ